VRLEHARPRSRYPETAFAGAEDVLRLLEHARRTRYGAPRTRIWLGASTTQPAGGPRSRSLSWPGPPRLPSNVPRRAARQCAFSRSPPGRLGADRCEGAQGPRPRGVQLHRRSTTAPAFACSALYQQQNQHPHSPSSRRSGKRCRFRSAPAVRQRLGVPPRVCLDRAKRPASSSVNKPRHRSERQVERSHSDRRRGVLDAPGVRLIRSGARALCDWSASTTSSASAMALHGETPPRSAAYAPGGQVA